MSIAYKDRNKIGQGWALFSPRRTERLIRNCFLVMLYATRRRDEGSNKQTHRLLGRALDNLEETLNEIQTARRQHAATHNPVREFQIKEGNGTIKQGQTSNRSWSPEDITKA